MAGGIDPGASFAPEALPSHPAFNARTKLASYMTNSTRPIVAFTIEPTFVYI